MLSFLISFFLRPAYAESTSDKLQVSVTQVADHYYATAVIEVGLAFKGSESKIQFTGFYEGLDEVIAAKEAKKIAEKNLAIYMNMYNYEYNVTANYSSASNVTVRDEESCHYILIKSYATLSFSPLRITPVEPKPTTISTYSSYNQVTSRSEPIKYDYLYDKNKFKEKSYSRIHDPGKTAPKAITLSLGIPMVISGIVCEGIVISDNIKASELTGQSTGSLYDGIANDQNWEFNESVKSEHKKLITSGILFGGVGVALTVIGISW